MTPSSLRHSRRSSRRFASVALLGTLSFAVTTAALADEERLPQFLKKVTLHNVGGVEPTADGSAVMLYRVPKSVRDRLTEPNKQSQKTGADTMCQARHSEIRFVLNEGEKPENIRLHLQAESPTSITFYWGDIYSGHRRLQAGGKAKPFGVTGHGLMYTMMDKYPQGRFANRVCRVIVDGAEVSLHGIEGDVRPPRPDELTPIMISYGTSISQGYNASRPDLQWNSLTARMLGHDLINLGSSGTAFCEPAMADYISAQPWDMAVLEISVNMVGNFDTPEFEKRATYLVNSLANSHPDALIFCISIFPWGVGHYWRGDANRKTKEFREVLRQIVERSGHKNVHYVHGPDLLSFSGLYHDMLHPSDMGMIEIATKLTQQIKAKLQ